MDPLRYESTPYDRQRHESFVKVSWCNGARQAWETLASRLRRPDVQCLVAHKPGDPDTLYGWAAVDLAARAVIWAYSRAWPIKRPVRRRKLMVSLLLSMGIDPSRPTPCLFWSPYAAEIAARGYRFFYAPKGLKEAA